MLKNKLFEDLYDKVPNSGTYKTRIDIKVFIMDEDGQEYEEGIYTALELKEKFKCSLSTIYDWIRNPEKYNKSRSGIRLEKIIRH